MNKQLKLAPIFNDHMVFQANKPIYIFGECLPDLLVEIQILQKHYTFITEGDVFCFELEPLPIIARPFNVLVKTKKHQYEIKDCLAGDVYLCTGQSNMQYVCKDVLDVTYKEFDNLRLYEVPKLPYVGAEKEFDWLYTNQPKWDVAKEEAIKTFSAIGYMIGRDIVTNHDIPIGIISCNNGDTTIYSWMEKSVIEKTPVLKPYLDEYNTWKDNFDSEEAFNIYYNQQVPKLMDFYGLLDQYRAEGYSSEEVYKKAYEKIKNPYLPMGPKNQNRPAGCFETMLKTIIPFSNKAIIYYQGENDVSRADIYKVAIQKLIDNWRYQFRDNLPFINCQIAGHCYSDTKGFEVARLRDAQMSMIDIPKKQYGVTAVDCGEKSNIHPTHKATVAKRIHQIIEAFIYNQGENALSPRVSNSEVEADKITIYTQDNDLDLMYLPKKTSGFYGVKADGEQVELEHIIIYQKHIIINGILGLKEIRYAYDAFPTLTIYTKNDLPLLPFRIILEDQ